MSEEQRKELIEELATQVKDSQELHRLFTSIAIKLRNGIDCENVVSTKVRYSP